MTDETDLRGLQLAVGVYVVVFALKLLVYFNSGVMALLAEALHTLTDIFVSGFLLAAAIYSRRGADELHMFGHGRAQNAAALVAATLFISFTSFRLYEEAIPRLFQTQEVSYENLSWVLGVLVVSMFLAAAPLLRIVTKKEHGAAVKAQLMELVNDELALLAALIGTFFILRGHPLADPIATIIVATIIVYNAIGLFRDNVSFLLGRSPGPEFLARVETVARSVKGVLDVSSVRAEYIGPDIVLGDMTIVVQRGITIEEADRIAEEVRESIRRAAGCRYCLVHADPSKPEHDQPSRGVASRPESP
ncbi:MAG: cation diffusion facilitator family transporter [Bacteroidetes bacterium]|nr:cation diffusion facilitator family transporter [Bacteroidota bacterium]